MDLQDFNHHVGRANEISKAILQDLMPYLDDYIMNAHDPFVEDFIWSMDDSRRTESVSKELTETDVPKLLLLRTKMSFKQCGPIPPAPQQKLSDEIPQEQLSTVLRRSSDIGKACGETG